MIVGIAGFKGAGKDAVADILVKHGFVKLSLASALKDIIATLFTWPRDALEGHTEISRKWREEPSSDWKKLAGSGVFEQDKEITPRLVMQRFGTDLFRNQVNDNFWIYVLLPKARELLNPKGFGTEGSLNRYRGVVIDDCRFPNELQECDYTIRVVRNGTENSSHISETAHLNWKYDCVLDNNSTIAELEAQVVKFFDIEQLNELAIYFTLGAVDHLLDCGEVYGVLTCQEDENNIEPEAIIELRKVRTIINYVIRHNTTESLKTIRGVKGEIHYTSLDSIIVDIEANKPNINDQLHMMFEHHGIEFHNEVRDSM